MHFRNDGDKVMPTDEQVLTLKAVAYSIKQLLSQEGKLSYLLFRSQGNLKLLIAAYVNEEYSVVLTEQAWHWIDATDEFTLLRVLLVKLMIDDANRRKNVKSQTDILKAMFENKLLTRKISDHIDNKAALEEVKGFVDQAD